MSINGSQKALDCVESEKIKIKYTCAGNSDFLLTHTWEFSLFSWDCNLSLIFCNASFSSLSLSLSDRSFLKSSSYICTCNHYDYVNFSRATTEILIHFVVWLLFKQWPSSGMHSKRIPLYSPATKRFSLAFFLIFFFKWTIQNDNSTVAHQLKHSTASLFVDSHN